MSAESHCGRDLASPGVSTSRVIAIGISLMVMMLGAIALLAWVFAWQVPISTPPAPQPLPAPQVRVGERLLRQQLEEDQRRRLTGYRWENADKTRIAIPIERSMQIIAARGPSAYDPIVPADEAATALGPSRAAAMQNPQFRVPSDKEPAASAARGER